MRKALLVKLELPIYHSMLQLQQQMQATDIQEGEIRMSINLMYVEGISEKIQCILRSHKIRSIFHTEMNTKYWSGTAVLKSMKLQYRVGNQITTLAVVR